MEGPAWAPALASEDAWPLAPGVSPTAGSRASASSAAGTAAGGSRRVLSFGAASATAGGAASPPPKALATERSADVTSLGMTQNVLPAPCASCGSVCRY